MRRREAIEKARGWLLALDIPPDDTERHILRIAALNAGRASHREIRDCAKKLPAFTWFHYTGDPVAALTAHQALLAARFQSPSLVALEAGYRSLLPESGEILPLLSDLLSIPPSPVAPKPPSAERLLCAGREELLEYCRIITMMTSRGMRLWDAGPCADLLPALAVSCARDWDVEASATLLRASAYLKLSGSSEYGWAVEWLLDQQQADGRFGLLHSEAARCGWDEGDWRLFFDRTIHAVCALAENVSA